MNRKQLEEVAEEIWRNNNPSEIFEWNEERIAFVKAFVEGAYYAIDKQIILPDLSEEQIIALNKGTEILLKAIEREKKEK